MSYTFRVIFDGVLAYVPDKPFFVPCDSKECKGKKCCASYGDPGEEKPICHQCDEQTGCWRRRKDKESGPVRSLAVLLPDLRRPKEPSVSGPRCRCRQPAAEDRGDQRPQLNFPRFREPHFPLLKFRLSDLREQTTRRVDLVCRDISEQNEEGILFLRREQIRFKMAAENASTFSFAGWAPCPVDEKKIPQFYKGVKKLPEWWGKSPDLASCEQLESLWWLPDLERIVTNPDHRAAIKAKPEVLPSYRGPFPQGLIARVECTGGRLRTFDFNRGVDGLPFQWRFAPPDDAESPGTWNRALANSLALEFFDVRSEIHIELRRLANEVVVEELVLAPAPGASRPVLEILITNREPDLLFQEESFSQRTLPDVDFQPFYEDLSSAPRDLFDKLPIPHPALGSFFGVVEKPCSGTLMKGQGDGNGQ